jgi:hypothetical protein
MAKEKNWEEVGACRAKSDFEHVAKGFLAMAFDATAKFFCPTPNQRAGAVHGCFVGAGRFYFYELTEPKVRMTSSRRVFL